MRLKAVNKTVVTVPVPNEPVEEKTAGGLYIAPTEQKRLVMEMGTRSEIVAIADELTIVELGDIIITTDRAGMKFSDEGIIYTVYREDEIACRIPKKK